MQLLAWIQQDNVDEVRYVMLQKKTLLKQGQLPQAEDRMAREVPTLFLSINCEIDPERNL